MPCARSDYYTPLSTTRHDSNGLSISKRDQTGSLSRDLRGTPSSRLSHPHSQGGDSSLVLLGSRRGRSPLHRFIAAAKPDAVPHARPLPHWQGCGALTSHLSLLIRIHPHHRIFSLLLQGFPDHPHRGQATVTYITQGASKHEDSAGHAGIIRAGGVQWMCAVRCLRPPMRRASHG